MELEFDLEHYLRRFIRKIAEIFNIWIKFVADELNFESRRSKTSETFSLNLVSSDEDS